MPACGSGAFPLAPGRLADQADVGAEGQVAELPGVVPRRDGRALLGPRPEVGQRRGEPGLVEPPGLVEGRLLLDVEVAEQPSRADLKMAVAVHQYLGQGADRGRGHLPGGLVAAIVDEVGDEPREGGRVGQRLDGPRRHQAEPRGPARQRGQGAGEVPPRVLPFPHQQEEQRPRADLGLRVVEEEDEPPFARIPQGQGCGDLPADRDDPTPRLGEDE